MRVGVLVAVDVLVGVLVGVFVAVGVLVFVGVLVGVFVTDGGTNWEVAVGSVVVMIDAIVSTRVTRPYALGLPATGATPASGSGP